MRRLCALLLLLGTMIFAQPTQPANAAVDVGISIGINLPAFPELVVVPGYPVYYAPSVHANYFFYDGYYWVFNIADGQWYASTWYNGPWVWVEPFYVPQPILVIPYRYYRARPIYWAGWTAEVPPHWGAHFGRDWEHRRAGWDRWDRSRAAAAAPPPTYQRNYPRDRYPAPTQQITIHNERYTYQVRDTQVRQQREVIVRQQSAGGAKANLKAERVEQPAQERKRQDAEQPARAPRRDSVQPPAAPREEAPAVERSRPERGRKAEPQRTEPETTAPREQATPKHAPRRDRPDAMQPPTAPRGERQDTIQPPAAPRQEPPAVDRSQPERGRKGEPQRVEPQTPAPREQASPRPAPREERPPAREERQEERQRDRGPERRSDDDQGRGRK
jgi:hypothetical protein